MAGPPRRSVVVRLVLICVGGALVAVGVPMMATGLTILVGQSPFIARRLRAIRRENLTIDCAIRRVAERLPDGVREVIRRIDP